jgi:hypothetical protein
MILWVLMFSLTGQPYSVPFMAFRSHQACDEHQLKVKVPTQCVAFAADITIK